MCVGCGGGNNLGCIVVLYVVVGGVKSDGGGRWYGKEELEEV